MSKKYSFENVHGTDSASVELHGRRRGWNILPKIACFLLAVLFWLLMIGLQAGEPDASKNADADASHVSADADAA